MVEQTPTEPIAQETTPEVKPKAKKKKAKRTVTHGNIHVLATFNNTIITVTDPAGNALTNASAGSLGFRGSKKGTAYAAQIAAEKAIADAKQTYGLVKADVFVKGIGMGRDAAVRTLTNQKVEIESLKDVTAIAHGGVRKRRAKRN
ncbi:MAG: 30S ribosomal protein S11 [Candidatus Saccharimonadales bacterium]